MSKFFTSRIVLLILLAILIVGGVALNAKRATDPSGTWQCMVGKPGHYVWPVMSVMPDGSATLVVKHMASLVNEAGSARRNANIDPTIVLNCNRSALGLGFACYDTAVQQKGSPYATGSVGLFHRAMHLHTIRPATDFTLNNDEQSTPAASAPPGASGKTH